MIHIHIKEKLYHNENKEEKTLCWITIIRIIKNNYIKYKIYLVKGSMLQAGRSRVQIPMRSLDFFN
jgi:hypothetical protein